PGLSGELSYEIIRRSLDARKKPEIFYEYVLDVKIPKGVRLRFREDKTCFEVFPETYRFPYENTVHTGERPVIAGFGPAGIFAALMLSRAGFRPVVLERGKNVEQRDIDVDTFWKTGILLPESNVQFGEGGAGAYSDGKLNTLIKDRDGKNRFILKTLVSFGAPEEILYDHKPHIGTDLLKNVIRNIREEIIGLGGEVRFGEKLTDLKTEKGTDGGLLLKGVLSESSDGKRTELTDTAAAILSVGHSARDTLLMLYERGVKMEARPFAVGLRVEHDRALVDKAQYGDAAMANTLGAANYKLTHRAADGRGVYTFCMCPGGYIVNASSEEGRLCVNGMSESKRDGIRSNSAVIVTVDPSDYSGYADPSFPPELSGILFQRALEEKAFLLGDGAVPVSSFREYREGKLLLSDEKLRSLSPMIRGNFSHAELFRLLPENLRADIIEGIEAFGRKIGGFSGDSVILAGVESRTSSPVRMQRDGDLHSSIRGLFPSGEGAGYAGGIVSAASDGILAAEKLAAYLGGKPLSERTSG
ncbi:MAG: FAD-dependent oxidoreductase, partial [Lachnospiraceae bacterium]|nr:FAD-dependent oxidoreductase [Lachnospiraceae bacterium]